MAADTFRVSGEGAEASFVSVDPATGIETTVFVFTTFLASSDPPKQGGPDEEPYTVIEVRQEAASGDLLFVGSYGGTDITPMFTTQGRDVISASLAGTVLLAVSVPETVSTTATFYFTFQATGPVVHEVDTDTAVIPGSYVQSSRINGFHRDATATGTLTIEDIINPVLNPLSTTDAELQRDNSGSVTVFPGSGTQDWIF